MTVSFHDVSSLFGFFVFIIILSQLVSGTMLAFSFIPEPMLVPIVRDEEDVEDLYIDDFFWLHERGVDMLFIFLYLHLFRKLYLNNYDYDQESAWKSGVFTFMVFQIVVFFGLVLCCTHLSEITLSIAANMFDTFFAGKGKFYWWLFTCKELNTDTVVRLAYIHYILAFFLAYLGLIHGTDMHYDWKNEHTFDGLEVELIWFDEALSNELGSLIEIFLILIFISIMLFPEPDALSYELFTWGDVGCINDVRFLSVAPHWYFRPYMAWLTVCPYHNIGLFGIIYYFFLLFYQPVIHGVIENNEYKKYFTKKLRFYILKKNTLFTNFIKNDTIEDNVIHQIGFWLFLCSCLYITSYLPYGRFYNKINGNCATLISFLYIFLYLGSPLFRKLVFLNIISIFWIRFFGVIRNIKFSK